MTPEAVPQELRDSMTMASAVILFMCMIRFNPCLTLQEIETQCIIGGFANEWALIGLHE